MKKSLLIILSVAFGFLGLAQNTKSFNYQAVVRDGAGMVVKSKAIGLRFTIDKGDTAKTVEYQEIHAVSTDLFGLVTAKIGSGTAQVGKFDTINWKGNTRMLKVEVDLNGNNSYALLSEAKLSSVPYALHAMSVENADDADADPNNEIQTLSLSGDTIYLSNGGFVKLGSGQVNNDNDSTNELINSFLFSNDTLRVSEAGNSMFVVLSGLNQSAAIAGLSASRIADSIATVAAFSNIVAKHAADSVLFATELTGVITKQNADSTLFKGLIDANTATLALDFDKDSTNEIQALSMSNDTIFLSNGGFVKIGAGPVNNDNDSTNELNASVSFSGDSIHITDAGGTKSTSLSSLNQSAALTALTAKQLADSTSLASSIGNNASSISTLSNAVSTGAYKDSSATNELQMLSMSNDTVYLTNGGFVVLPAPAVNNDNDSTNELQVLSISNDTIMLSNGGFVVLPAAPVAPANNDNDSTNELNTSVTFSGDSIHITDAGGTKSVALSSLNQSSGLTSLASKQATDSLTLGTASQTNATNLSTLTSAVNSGAYKDSSATNELQVLSISNDTIFLTNGGFAVLPAAVANNDNDSTNEIQTLSFSGDSVKLSDGGFANLSAYNTWTKSDTNVYRSSGRVGIGTSTPSTALDIRKTASGDNGVYISAQNSGVNTAVYSIAKTSPGTATATALFGWATGTDQTANTAGTSPHYGVLGRSEGKGVLGIGVYGYSTGQVTAISRGLQGISNSATSNLNQGVYGISTISRTSASGYNAGVFGQASGHSLENIGVYGYSNGTGTWNYGGDFWSLGTGTSENYGVYTNAAGAATNYAIYADATSTSGTNYGVYGAASTTGSNKAGYFSGHVVITGDLAVTGAISKGSGTFKIDHPLDPENKYLVHSFVESPEMMNVYNGNVTTDANGYATVTLPDYFEASNKDFRYQLTSIGQFAQVIVKEEIVGNQFVVQTDKPNVKVSWQVTGVRQDPYSNDHRIVPVVDKTEDEKGLYLHPESYGKDASKALYKPLGRTDRQVPDPGQHNDND